jgi:hypothetical protein
MEMNRTNVPVADIARLIAYLDPDEEACCGLSERLYIFHSVRRVHTWLLAVMRESWKGTAA